MQWTLKPNPDPKITASLANELGIDLVLAKLLVQRNITNFQQAKSFFRPNLEELYNPFLMKDMDIAVTRILKAIDANERILIYGDYDVDGTTSVSLLYTYLSNITSEIATYIPDRYKEGYGISYTGIDFANDNDFSLIIALDCGIKAIDKVVYASEKNIDIIICDHHRPGDEIPNAVAVLDPKRPDCEYPYKELCGCGVGFKLIQAIEQQQQYLGDTIFELLDLVSIAIAADIVPITGENRILAYYGLQVINSNPRPGIKALLNQSKKVEFSVSDLVFMLAPRINSAGRIAHGNNAVELLTENNYEIALQIAADIEVLNSERKNLDKVITEEAIQQLIDNNEEDAASTVVYNDSWHKGVIGIVASRLIENYYKPTVVFTKSNEKLTASARSVKGFDIYEALDQCSMYIEQFGGHKYAAGLTIKEENFLHFKAKFEEVVKSTLAKEYQQPEILIDSEINLEQITPKFYRILKQLEPFGPQNLRPVFLTTGLRDNGYGKRVGEDGDHLKLNVFQAANQTTISCIGFRLGDKFANISNGKPFDAVYSIDENHWNGHTSLQLNLKDIKPED